MPTVSEILSIAEISESLAVRDTIRTGLFAKGLNLRLPRMIYLLRKNLEAIYTYDNAYSGVTKVANYLYAICAPFSAEASRLIALGLNGATVTPASTAGMTYLIPITSDNFSSATAYDNDVIVGRSLVIFWNDIPRYLLPDEFEMTATGINILISGFDATVNDYRLYIYIVNPA